MRSKAQLETTRDKTSPATKLLHQLPASALVLDASSGLLKVKHLRPRPPPNPPSAKTQLSTATLSPSFLPPPSCHPTFSPTAQNRAQLSRAQNRSQSFSDLGSKSCSVMSNSMRPHGLEPTTLLFSLHGILQGRILEWIAIPFSRGSS